MSIKRLYQRELPQANLLLTRVTVLDPVSGLTGPHDLVVRNGVITEIKPPGSAEKDSDLTEINGEGKHLFPAFVDPHVHLRTPGQNHKETIATGTASAAAGGYCQIVAMPNTTPTIDSTVTLEAVNSIAAREAVVPVGVLASVTRGLEGDALTDMTALRDAGAIGFTDDGKPVTDAALLRRALAYQKLCGGVIALHEEDPSLSAKGSIHEGEVSARLGVLGIPSISESTMIARDAAIARYEGGRIHIQHLSAVESVEAIAAAKAVGVAVTAEASPHHLTLTDHDVSDLSTSFKMNPPLRAESDRQALIAGLRDGTIDCIATDHAPHSALEKDVPFELAPMGTTGLEAAFAVLNTDLVNSGVLTLEMVVEKMSTAGKVYDLTPPQVAVGQQANLCLVDLNERWVVGADGYSSRSSNCCFDGKAVEGKVKLTVAAGAVAYSELPGVEVQP